MKQIQSLLLSFAIATAPVYAQETPAESPAEDQPEAEAAKAEEPAANEPAAVEQKPEPKQEPTQKPNADKESSQETGAPPKGIAKLIPGIVTASVGTGFGLLLIGLSRVNCKDLTKDRDDKDNNGDRNNTDDDLRDCEKLKPTYRKVGIGSIVVGLGVGLPLIYFGVEERKVYNQWKSAQPDDSQANRSTRPYGQADLVLLESPDLEFSPGIGLTYNF